MVDRIILGFADINNEFNGDYTQFMPTKIGGKPKWLNLDNIPNKSDIECKICKQRLIFLLQIYAPFDKYDYSYHRMLYIFCCRNIKCHKKNNSIPFKVLRFQNEEKDLFKDKFMLEENIEKYSKQEKDIFDKYNVSICDICGIGVSKEMKYCSIECENNDEKFPLYEILVEELKKEKKKDNFTLEMKLLKEYENKVRKML